MLGLQLNLVPPTAAGVTVHRDWDMLGQRAADSGTITFDRVDTDPALCASVPGRAPLPQNAVRYQAGFAAVLVGIGIGALRAAIPFVAERARPWPPAGVDSAADDPMVRRLTGELVSALAAAYSLTLATGDRLDASERGDLTRTELAVPIYAAKAAATRAALAATSEMYALMGASAARTQTSFDRHWRNARTRLAARPGRLEARRDRRARADRLGAARRDLHVSRGRSRAGQLAKWVCTRTSRTSVSRRAQTPGFSRGVSPSTPCGQ